MFARKQKSKAKRQWICACSPTASFDRILHLEIGVEILYTAIMWSFCAFHFKGALVFGVTWLVSNN